MMRLISRFFAGRFGKDGGPETVPPAMGVDERMHLRRARATLETAGLDSGAYLCRATPVDRRDHKYLVLIDVQSSALERLPLRWKDSAAASISQSARACALVVGGVYWQVIPSLGAASQQPGERDRATSAETTIPMKMI